MNKFLLVTVNNNFLWFKVSEYPFKQNRNTLKNMSVLLYTYFVNIYINVLRPNFFNICNLTFLYCPNIGKIRVKAGPKLTTFPTLWAPAPAELQFSVNFFYWYTANQEANKTVPAILSFECFLDNQLLIGFMETTLSKIVELML